MTEHAAPHIPVMLNEVLAALAPKEGEVYVDGTLGAAGYTRAALARATCRVIGIDRDPSAIAAAKEQGIERLTPVQARFSEAEEVLAQNGEGASGVDGFMLDVGVSSMQIDQAARGFSFRRNGPLDMRMTPEEGQQSAAELLEVWSEEELAWILKTYGEERHARRIARTVKNAIETEGPVRTTDELADLVRGCVPRSRDGIDPATRSFQALRIAVNRELDELADALGAAERILKPGGRLIVVSFHSLEDRIVKTFLRDRAEGKGKSGKNAGSRHLPPAMAEGESCPAPTFELKERKAVFPSDAEQAANPRARSARMRWAVRTDAPPIDAPVDRPRYEAGARARGAGRRCHAR